MVTFNDSFILLIKDFPAVNRIVMVIATSTGTRNF